MPRPAPSAGARPPASLPPALQRRLRHVATVKAVRAKMAVAAGGVALVALAGGGLSATATGLVEEAAAPPVQSLVVAAAAAPAPVPRDDYQAVLMPALQYPLPLASGIASGYGPRDCAGCYSNFHNGIDIFPGAGTPIQAIAGGVVTSAHAASGGDMGVFVKISHQIDGQQVTSVYGHLQAGSLALRAGDVVTVGDVIGRVGATGNAQGAHLHFEIWPGGGSSVNPYSWLAARIR